MATAVEFGGEHSYFPLWFSIVAMRITMIYVYPHLIQPLFDIVKPLPEGDLKTAIRKLAGRLSFPVTEIFIMDGSRRSSRCNAYLYGVSRSKRIVLLDTLIEHMTTEEICSIISHELGHWSCSHIPKRLILEQFNDFVMLLIASKIFEKTDVYQAFGFTSMSFNLSFTLVLNLNGPCQMIAGLFVNAFCRAQEFEADRFACSLGYRDLLWDALVKLHDVNGDLVAPDELYCKMHRSHPSLIRRLEAIENYKFKSD